MASGMTSISDPNWQNYFESESLNFFATALINIS